MAYRPFFGGASILQLSTPFHLQEKAFFEMAEAHIYGSNCVYEQGIIDWSFLRRLLKLQDEESLCLGNSLNINHIVCQRHTMKVNLALKILSSSVAHALEVLKDDFKLPEFKGFAPKIQFIRNIERVFNILKSRNPYGKYFTSPLRHSNISFIIIVCPLLLAC